MSLQNKVKIFQEVNFCQVLLFREIKQVLHLLIGLIKAELVYLTQT